MKVDILVQDNLHLEPLFNSNSYLVEFVKYLYNNYEN